MENRETSTALIETLIRKGWCFRDVEMLKGLIQIHIATVGSVDSIESELLLNMDLRSIGGKSLPNDPSLMEKLSHLQGPKVLQIVSTTDISQSSIEASSRSSSNRRLLRICLTDGYSEIVAIEYSPITSIHDDIVPGTKVRLENKAAMHSGIVCLNSKSVTVLGGVVQTLYEEWQMNRKYSGFSRSSLKPSQRIDGDGPPPFVKLQIDTCSQKPTHHHTSFLPESISKTTVPASVKAGESSDSKEMKAKNNNTYEKFVDTKAAALSGQIEEKPSSSESRPKEVSEAVPVQNQAASQKLLQKMNQPSLNYQHSRGPKHRGKGREEEPAVFTLDEWEKRKGEVKLPTRHDVQDIGRDEELARQLQEQLDLEDFEAQTKQESEAEKIRMSMFNFQRMEEDRNQGRSGFRGRGRGRGRRRFG